MHVYTFVLLELSVFDSWGDMTLSYWLTGMFPWLDFEMVFTIMLIINQSISLYSVGGARKIAAKPNSLIRQRI